MTAAFVCEGLRTPIGRYAGALAHIRTDDLAALPLAALRDQFPQSDWERIDEIVLGCVNQAGEDNRNVARMASLIAGIPHTVPAATVNRLCASGMEAVAVAARAIAAGEIELAIAGGVESMTRSPLVLAKAEEAFSRNAEIYDTTLGWRFINPTIDKRYGAESMGETAENVAEAHNIDRESQDRFAFQSQQRAAAAKKNGIFSTEIIAVKTTGKKRENVTVIEDEHPRPDTSLAHLAQLSTPFRKNGTVTAGNSSGINDGACAMFVASERAAAEFGLKPTARIVSSTSAGVEPRLMGLGPIPAIQKLLNRARMAMSAIDLLELNEAFAAQVLAVTRAFGLPDDCDRVNPNGGAIALGHPLGMSGARLVLTASRQLERSKERYAIASMCVGVGQGTAILLERV